MNKDIDSLSADLTQEMQMSSLEKALPPKLRYRYYRWIKKLRQQTPKVTDQQLLSTVEKAVKDIETIKSLKKHQIAASFFDDGTIKMDFGAKVNEKVKKAALDWARKRGLKTLEESVNKSTDSNSYKIFGKDKISNEAVVVKVVILNP
jgi:hypothetical protein